MNKTKILNQITITFCLTIPFILLASHLNASETKARQRNIKILNFEYSNTDASTMKNNKILLTIENKLKLEKSLPKSEMKQKKQILDSVINKLNTLTNTNTAILSTDAYINNLYGRSYIGLSEQFPEKRLDYLIKAREVLFAATTINGSSMNYRNLGIAYDLIGDEFKNKFWSGISQKNRNLVDIWKNANKANENYELSVKAFEQSKDADDFLDHTKIISDNYDYVLKEKIQYQENLAVRWFLTKSRAEIDSITTSK